MKNKIILVAFPFDDLSGSKVRPALCLSKVVGDYNHVVIAFITSRVEKANEEFDISLYDNDDEFENTGLRQSSAVRLHRLVTIPIIIVKRELGLLPEKYHDDLRHKLRSLFSI